MNRIFNIMVASVAIIAGLILSLIEQIVSLFIPRSALRKDITGQIALVTGAGSGLGREVAKRLAGLGATIVSWDISEEGNKQTKKDIEESGGKCYTYIVNLCDKNAIYDAANVVRKEVGKVDILINNAGIVSGKELLDCPDELIQRTFDVNILSYIWTAKAFLPGMQETGSGHIVSLSSIAGFIGSRKQCDYSATKFAVRGFDMALREELDYKGYDKIYMTVIFPYYINTGMFDGTKSSVLPIMELPYVADEVTDGILMNKREVILPSILRPLILLTRILSDRACTLVANAFGSSEMMNNFKGREKKE